MANCRVLQTFALGGLPLVPLVACLVVALPMLTEARSVEQPETPSLEVLARRPCTLQAVKEVHATSGAAFFDYIVADAVALPPEHAPLFRESVLALPPSMLPNSHRALYPTGQARLHEPRAPAAHPACEWDDGTGRVGLLALYEHYKVDPDAMATWLAIAKDTQAALVMQAGAFPALTTPVLHERARRASLPPGQSRRSTSVRRKGEEAARPALARRHGPCRAMRSRGLVATVCVRARGAAAPCRLADPLASGNARGQLTVSLR